MNLNPNSIISESPAHEQWKNIGIRNHHGIAVPLFSLHSSSSCGIGEFTDLIPLFSWCKDAGVEIIQLLPLNDTGRDTSPYSALTAFALNPIHIGLQSLPHVLHDHTLQAQVDELKKLTKSQRIPYRQVHDGKLSFLRNYFRTFLSNPNEVQALNNFKERNKHWCYDYALFKAIKIKLSWESWETWSLPFADPSTIVFEQLPEDLRTETEFQQFIQYLCFEQFHQVKEIAEAHGILIKGDIPILIDRESADVWRHRELFQLEFSAGAPPDMYAEEGQKWGFPTYNWDAIAAQRYRWWVDRLEVAARFYHIYRIDHIVGFYRIWGVPLHLPPKAGHFIPGDENTWVSHGETILRVMLEKCNMLPIGEDLGTVPPLVRESLKRLGICGTKVMRWERRWNEDRSYIPLKDYPVESMTTVSTHDSETLGQWWTNQTEEAKLYAETVGWTYDKELSYEHRFEILRASHHSASLFHINLLNEYLALYPEMVWPNPEDERINIPGTITDRNWSYRFKPSVEEITKNGPLQEAMRKIIGNK
jgi:4-alpha-glucanotransferase